MKKLDFLKSMLIAAMLLVGSATFAQTMYINQNTTINTYTEATGDIIIAPNQVLLLYNTTLIMPADAKIVVKQGARLVVNGSEITTLTPAPWQGVQVWGNVNKNQLADANGHYKQGMISLLNNAVLSNAKLAVDLQRPGYRSSYGGIIHATDATFRNNGEAVHFYPYKNIAPNQSELPYNATFENCTFEITANYPGKVPFEQHISLSHDKWVDFAGCTFSLDPNAANVAEFNTAIYSYNAGLITKAYCSANVDPCPDNMLQKTTFTGFHTAITSWGNNLYNSSVLNANHTHFYGNAYGIQLYLSNNAVITNCDFDLSNYDFPCLVGVKARESRNFTIEENNFTGTLPITHSPETFGVVIDNAQSEDEVYKNNFNAVTYANFADGENAICVHQGLSYICNSNNNNYADFFNNKWIQTAQGASTLAAGNVFSQSAHTKWHFYSKDQTIWYFYDEGIPYKSPDPNKLHNVILSAAPNHTCPSHLNSTPIDVALSPQQAAAVSQTYFNRSGDFEQLETLFNNYKDGGNTPAELQDVRTAQAADMWDLRAQLLNHSPHLSQEVLKEVISRQDILPSAAIFDVLKANPDELRSETLFDYMQAQGDVLPDYMLAVLRSVANGTTYKTALITQMAIAKNDYRRACRQMVLNQMVAEETDMASLRLWLGRMKSADADRQIVASYIEEGNFDDALALANMLPQLYNMDAVATAANDAYIDLIELYSTIVADGRDLYEMTATEKAQITQMANADNGIATAQAKAILRGVYGEKDMDYPLCPNPQEEVANPKSPIHIEAIADNTLAEAYGLTAECSPNPAQEWTTIYYQLPAHAQGADMYIQDAQGHTLQSIHLQDAQGQYLLDTRAMANGVYIYRIQIEDITKTGKFVVAK